MSREISPIEGSLCGSLLGYLHRAGTKPNTNKPKGKNASIGENKPRNRKIKEYILTINMETILSNTNILQKYYIIKTGVIILYYSLDILIGTIYEISLVLKVILVIFIGDQIIFGIVLVLQFKSNIILKILLIQQLKLSKISTQQSYIDIIINIITSIIISTIKNSILIYMYSLYTLYQLYQLYRINRWCYNAYKYCSYYIYFIDYYIYIFIYKMYCSYFFGIFKINIRTVCSIQIQFRYNIDLRLYQDNINYKWDIYIHIKISYEKNFLVIYTRDVIWDSNFNCRF